MLHDNVDDFLASFPEGDIIHIDRANFQCPSEINLLPCTEHGDLDHKGNLVPGIFFKVVIKKEKLSDGLPFPDDPPQGV